MTTRHKTPLLTIVFVVAQAMSYGIVALGYVAICEGWIK